MQVWNVLHVARWKYRTQKWRKRHLGTIPQLCRAISLQLRHVSTIGKNLLSSNIFPTCPHNMVNFGLLAAEIVSGVWSTPVTFNGFRFLAGRPSGWALAHILVHIIIVVSWTADKSIVSQSVCQSFLIMSDESECHCFPCYDQKWLQEFIRRWDSERELLRSAPGSYPNSLK